MKSFVGPILLGEFGACGKAPQGDRIEYTVSVARAAESCGQVVYDVDQDAWNKPIYRAPVPPCGRAISCR